MTNFNTLVEEKKKEFREKWEGANLQNEAITTRVMEEMLETITSTATAVRGATIEEIQNIVQKWIESSNPAHAQELFDTLSTLTNKQ